MQAARGPSFHEAFIENFSEPTSEFFNYNYRRSGYDYRYYSGHKSLSENGTEVSTDPEYTFTVTGARNLKANFAINMYTVTYKI